MVTTSPPPPGGPRRPRSSRAHAGGDRPPRRGTTADDACAKSSGLQRPCACVSVWVCAISRPCVRAYAGVRVRVRIRPRARSSGDKRGPPTAAAAAEWLMTVVVTAAAPSGSRAAHVRRTWSPVDAGRARRAYPVRRRAVDGFPRTLPTAVPRQPQLGQCPAVVRKPPSGVRGWVRLV